MNNGMKPKVDISSAPWVKCETNQLFETKLMFKKVSAILSPTGREEHVPIEVVICSKCGKIPKFFQQNIPDLPEELKSECDVQ